MHAYTFEHFFLIFYQTYPDMILKAIFQKYWCDTHTSVFEKSFSIISIHLAKLNVQLACM